jgi:hypothetical protein
MTPLKLLAVAAAATLTITLAPNPADATPPTRFGKIQYDSPGSDHGSNRSLNAEWVTIVNRGARTWNLKGWTLRDRTGHVYRFPRFRLHPHKSVRIHTGHGRNDRNDLYWRQSWYVWNNDGDTAVLKRANHKVVDRCRWRDGSGRTGC